MGVGAKHATTLFLDKLFKAEPNGDDFHAWQLG